ncbi:MAG: hypothetical protein QM751_11710 [Paludibacteraceae bacterium]
MKKYYYKVSAFSNGEYTEASNQIKVTTLTTNNSNIFTTNDFNIKKNINGIEINSQNILYGNSIELFNISGQKIYESMFDKNITISLRAHGIYILKINRSITKIVW